MEIHSIVSQIASQISKEMGFEIEPAFFQDIEHRPKPTVIEAGGIPLIDLSTLNSVDPTDDDAPRALSGLIKEIEASCREWGFFQVINHGVPLELLERVQRAAREFFAKPAEEKRKVRRSEENPLGYYDTEHTKNVRDWKEVFDFLVEDWAVTPGDGGDQYRPKYRNQWPAYSTELREACEEYSKGVEKLAYKLIELISLTLNLPANRLNGVFASQYNLIRLNRYPPCPSPHLALGVGRHKDPGALTVLSQDDVGGLDVKRKSDGEWIRVKPIPNSYIINVGDIIQVWSNDKYESVEHRVTVNSEKERISIPLFFNPAYYVMVKPLEELVNEQNPSKYNEYNCGEFFMARKKSNFKKLGEENIQISHFKKTE